MPRPEALAAGAATAGDRYPTRGAEERILERVDPVVYGEGPSGSGAGLSAEQVAAYDRDGFLVLPGVFSPEETAAMRAEAERLAEAPELMEREELIREPDSRRARSVFSAHVFSDLFGRLARDRRILDKVMRLLGDGVYIHHSRINIKRALNGKSFPWHSDFETWHAEDGIPRMRILSAWVMLDANDAFNGPLFLVPGSHRRFVACAGATPENHHAASLRKQEYGVPSVEALRDLVEAGGMAAAHGPPGTLVIHEGNTMHGSPDNITPFSRTNVFFVYNSVENTPAERPFAAPAFRPRFLGSRDFTPLEPAEGPLAG
jgi:ectoine hydroxylase